MILPGGEAGILTAWWHSADRSQWRWHSTSPTGEQSISRAGKPPKALLRAGVVGAADEAEVGGDEERKARARQELEFIEHELAAAYGLSGRARRLADPAERARKAVANRIRDAVSRIEANHPALGRHLRTSIRTGTFCSSEPERAMTWTVRATR